MAFSVCLARDSRHVVVVVAFVNFVSLCICSRRGNFRWIDTRDRTDRFIYIYLFVNNPASAGAAAVVVMVVFAADSVFSHQGQMSV